MKDSTALLLLLAGAAVLTGGVAGAAYVISRGKLNASEISTVAQAAGFSGNDLNTAVAVALAESSGNTDAVGDVGIGQGSFGLWQISSFYHPEYGPDFTKLFDPQTNANAAFEVYQKAGNSFSPWSTFNNGTYLEYV